MENISILSKRYDYASKIISKWRAANREKINIHYSKRKCKQKKSAYQKLLERNFRLCTCKRFIL